MGVCEAPGQCISIYIRCLQVSTVIKHSRNRNEAQCNESQCAMPGGGVLSEMLTFTAEAFCAALNITKCTSAHRYRLVCYFHSPGKVCPYRHGLGLQGVQVWFKRFRIIPTSIIIIN